ncbi:MAG TPA: DUF4157 domain-containing protein, partial [Longimicrobiaceae bacterium]|nr:DUF4157 domain-containing protein [Longimicrobiaceae bacterium]
MNAATHRAGGRERTAPSSHSRTPGHGPERRPARAPAAPAGPAIRQAGNQAVQRMLRPGSAPAISTAPSAALQRCGCGGGAPPIAAAPLPLLQRCCGAGGGTLLADPLLQRQAAGPAPAAAALASAVPADAGRPLDPATRAAMEARFGRDLRDVRIHTGPEADAAARGLNARAFTVGRDIVFAEGEYNPASPAGRRLLAHELVHTVQQRGVAPPAPGRPLPVSEPGDALEREADHVASQVTGGARAAPVTPAGPAVQRQILPSWSDIEAGAAAVWEETTEAASDVAEWAEETASDVVEGVEETVDTVMGFAREVWDQATALASALGSAVTLSGTSLVINVPSLPACPQFALQFSLPEIGGDIPIAVGLIPLHPTVQIYGMLALHLGVKPEISAQIGPCQLHGLRIVINPLGPSFSAAGSLTATVGLGLGAELRAALKGEVGVQILWPKPPLLLQIPVASVEAGLAGFGRGIVLSQVTIGGAFTGSLSGFSLVAFQ